ncbi:MAG: flagellar hook-length control protein FliK [Phycisphaerales bacterium]
MDPVSTLTSTSNQAFAAQTSTTQAQTATFDAALASLLTKNTKPVAQQNSETIQALKSQPKTATKRRSEHNGPESTPDIAAMNAAQLGTRPQAGEVAQADAQVENDASNAPSPKSSKRESCESQPSSKSPQSDTTQHQSDQPTQSTSKSTPATASAQATSKASQSSYNQAATTHTNAPQPQTTRETANQSTPRVAAIASVKSNSAKSSSNQSNTTNNAAQPFAAKRSAAFKSLLAQAQPVRHAVQQREVQATALRAMQLTLAGNGGDVSLKMTPGDLGTLHAKLSVQDARVNADFIATTEVARDLLVQSVDELRSALETRGLSVDQITISGPEGKSTFAGQDAQSFSNHDRGGAANTSADAGSSQSRSDGDTSRARTPNRQLVAAHADSTPLWSVASEATSTANGLEWIV